MQIEQFFDLVSNKEKYEAQLSALKKAEEEARKIIELVGPAKDIQAMRAAARNDLEKVAQEVADTREALAKEAETARASVQKLWDDVGVQQNNLAKQEKLLATTVNDLVPIRAKLEKQVQDNQQMALTLAEKEKYLAAKEAELNAKLAKLKALAE